jgi:hypothetical protein
MTVNLKSSREQIEEYSRYLEKKVVDRTAKLEEQNFLEFKIKRGLQESFEAWVKQEQSQHMKEAIL